MDYNYIVPHSSGDDPFLRPASYNVDEAALLEQKRAIPHCKYCSSPLYFDIELAVDYCEACLLEQEAAHDLRGGRTRREYSCYLWRQEQARKLHAFIEKAERYLPRTIFDGHEIENAHSCVDAIMAEEQTADV